MSPSFDVEEMERFSTRRDVTRAISTISEATTGLNAELSQLAPTYDSVVVFSHVDGEPIATPVAHLDATTDVDPSRHDFRNKAIIGRRVLLSGTALGETLQKPTSAPRYKASRINHTYPQATFTHPLFHDQRKVGALQYSFTPTHEDEPLDLPDVSELKPLAKHHERELAHVARAMERLHILSREFGSLALGLEFEESVAPNAFIVRWDVTGSSRLALGDKHAALDAYTNQVHRYIKTLTEAYRASDGAESYSDQGDGAYVILPLGSETNPYDKKSLKQYRATTGAQFLTSLNHGIAAIGRHYEDISPRIRITSSFGFVEANSIGRLKSKAMYELAAQQK